MNTYLVTYQINRKWYLPWEQKTDIATGNFPADAWVKILKREENNGKIEPLGIERIAD